jgi:hypothetical protein
MLRSNAVAMLIMASCICCVLDAAAAAAAGFGTPLLAQAGAGLVAPGGVEAAGKPVKQLPAGAQKMADNFNKAGTADAAAAADAPAAAGQPSTAGLSATLVKYAPSYVLMLLAIGLGIFVVCRPPGLNVASLAQKKDKK